jgi:hypothetical protein
VITICRIIDTFNFGDLFHFKAIGIAADLTVFGPADRHRSRYGQVFDAPLFVLSSAMSKSPMTQAVKSASLIIVIPPLQPDGRGRASGKPQ